MTRKELQTEARKYGVFVHTNSPGDSVTRYRFQTADVDYFDASQSQIIATVLGLQEAVLFFEGLRKGFDLSRDRGGSPNPPKRKEKRSGKRRTNPSGKLDLDVDSPEKVPVILREASEKYFESEIELASAWQDKRAGRVWGVLAKILENAADKSHAAVSKQNPRSRTPWLERSSSKPIKSFGSGWTPEDWKAERSYILGLLESGGDKNVPRSAIPSYLRVQSVNAKKSDHTSDALVLQQIARELERSTPPDLAAESWREQIRRVPV